MEKPSFFQGNQKQLFQIWLGRRVASFYTFLKPNYPSFHLKCPRKCQKPTVLTFFQHFPTFVPLPLLPLGVDPQFDHILPLICILLKLDDAKFGIFNSFFQKLSERNLWEVGSTRENKSKKDQINHKSGKSIILEETSNEKSNNINPAQDNAKAEMYKRKRRRPLIIVAGGSIVKGLKGWLMSRRANVKVFFFSGSTITDIEHFIKPLINKQPIQIILHNGTNDSLRSSPLEVTAAIKATNRDYYVTWNSVRCIRNYLS